MQTSTKVAIAVLLGVILVLALCSGAGLALYRSGALAFIGLDGRPVVPTYPVSAATPSLLIQMTDRLPALTPASSWGATVKMGDFNVTTQSFAFVHEYALEGGEKAAAPPGGAFLWVQVGVENAGQAAMPADFVFEVYYAGQRMLKSPADYSNALDYPSFQMKQLNPGEKEQGWILFEMPERMQIGQGYLLARSMQSLDYTAWIFPQP